MAIQIDGLKTNGEIILHWVVPPNYMGILDEQHCHADAPCEYAIELLPEKARKYGGVMLWGKVRSRDEWYANPSPRLLVLFLLNEMIRPCGSPIVTGGIRKYQVDALVAWSHQVINSGKDGE